MKKLSLFILAITISFAIFAQDGYKFTDEIRLGTTSVKDQYASGTCWSFSTLSFYESEMERVGVENVPDLSEMFIVRQCYADKAEKYVRLHGELNFGGGGAFVDIPYVHRKYGLVPEEAFNGLNYGTKGHVHGELDAVLKAYVDAVIENKNRKLSTAWLAGFNGILDAYLGEYPETFTYEGKEYTPRTFADEVTKLNPDDYISVTSFSHHPFYSSFAIEVPDNWLWGQSYNLPLDEFIQVFDYALDNGYTIAWGADVSEEYFSHSAGVAIVPDINIAEMTDTERGKWESQSKKERYNLDKPGKEKVVTQEMRQEHYDNYKTTDDHGLHIVGRAKDQAGTKYYIVKNSWNTDNPYDGYVYVSEEFVKYKTMNIMIHKDAVPKKIAKKLGLK